jgi:hypothetical protein
MVARVDPLERELAEIDAAVERAPSFRNKWGPMPIIILFFVLLIFSGLLWYTYSAGVRTGSEEAAPFLSLNGPIKVPPPSPGGVTVAHQEKTVFNKVEGKEGDTNVERILPPPEKPLNPLVSVTSSKAPNKPIKKPLVSIAKSARSVPQQAPQPAPIVRPPVRPKNAKSPTKLTPVAPASKTVASKPANKPVQKTGTGGTALKNSYRIQTGALSTRAKAQGAWRILAAKHKDLLSGLQLNVARAVVRGTVYFRVQAGPFPDRATTADICNALKERGQGCIVVTPR